MSAILVFIEQNNGQAIKAGLSAITAAQQIKTVHGVQNIYALVLGTGSHKLASSLGGQGLSKVFYSEDVAFGNFRSVAFSLACQQAMQECQASYFVTAATSSGRDLSPRLAGKLQAGQASDVIAINADKTFKRPMYAGNAIVDVEILSDKKVITVRPTAFDASLVNGTSEAQEIKVSVPEDLAGKVISIDKPQSARPELSDASIVVSGGRALQSAENFEKYIFPLADALGAAVGASRAAVDSGYAPNDWQVGQTGKVVAPQLYIAVGISGAIQHLAGMKDSKVIVAINKDPEAPIFEVADYGLVADLYQVVEPLTKLVSGSK